MATAAVFPRYGPRASALLYALRRGAALQTAPAHALPSAFTSTRAAAGSALSAAVAGPGSVRTAYTHAAASGVAPCLPRPGRWPPGAWQLAGRWLTGAAAGAASRISPASPAAAAAATSAAGGQLPRAIRRFVTSSRSAAGGPAELAAVSTTATAAGGARCVLLGGGGGGRVAARAPAQQRQQGLQRLAARRLATQAAQAPAAAGSAPAAARPPPRGLRGRLGQAARLQLAAAWQAYGPAVYAAAAVTSVYLLWRVMYGVTSTFISVNEKLAEYGLMGLALTLVLLASLYGRWRLAVSPAAVYRQALVRLNTHPGVLEVMGAPLVGSEVRAYVVTGGGLYLSKKLRPKLRGRRIQMMFPLSGSERKGLVSLEAKRKKGKYIWKLLAVDLGPELQAALPAGGASGLSAAPPPRAPAAAAPPPPTSRVYVIGDAEAYSRGGVLSELRSPFLQALSNSRSYEVEDELEDELDELALPTAGGGGGGGGAVKGAAAAAGSALHRVAAAASELLSKPAAGAAAAAGPAAAATDAKAGPAPSTPVDSPPASPLPSARPRVSDGGSAAPSPAAAAASTSTAPVTSPASWWSRARTLLAGPSSSAGAGS